MSKIELNSEELEQIGNDIANIANRFNKSFDNIKFEIELSEEEKAMLFDVKQEFIAKTLNTDVDNASRLISISNKYSSLVNFYINEAPKIKKMIEFGIIPVNAKKYDVNLSLEDAVVKYTGYSIEEAKQINDKVSIAKERCEHYVESIRTQYNGSNLGQLVGKNISDYKEKLDPTTEFIKKAVLPAADSFIKAYPQSQGLDNALKNFANFLNRYTVPQVETQSQKSNLMESKGYPELTEEERKIVNERMKEMEKQEKELEQINAGIQPTFEKNDELNEEQPEKFIAGVPSDFGEEQSKKSL